MGLSPQSENNEYEHQAIREALIFYSDSKTKKIKNEKKN
jgi:hypothetical protein